MSALISDCLANWRYTTPQIACISGFFSLRIWSPQQRSLTRPQSNKMALQENHRVHLSNRRLRWGSINLFISSWIHWLATIRVSFDARFHFSSYNSCHTSLHGPGVRYDITCLNRAFPQCTQPCRHYTIVKGEKMTLWLYDMIYFC